MKRITVMSALCLAALAALASPAAAAPPLTFSATVQADQSVSLFTSSEGCTLRPCGYTWIIDGTRAARGRSFVVQLTAGCHDVVLRVTERKFRNPTPSTRRALRTVCIAADAAGTSAVGELSEIPADAPSSETGTTDPGSEGTDPTQGTTDVPPSETDTTVVTEPTADTPPADTTSTAPPADTTTIAPPADATAVSEPATV